MQAKLNIVLHPNQKLIHESPARFKCVKTGKRFGKTYWALFEILQKAGSVNNGLFWYCAPTYRQAKSIAWWTLKWMLPREFIKRSVENDLMIELINGTRIELKGEDNIDSLRGTGINGLIRDECALSKEEIWPRILQGQLTRDGFAYFISSPNPNGRNWWTNFCEDAKRKKMAGDKDWDYWYFTIWDNPTRTLEENELLKNSMSDHFWDLEYMAKESDFAGVLYSEFSFNKHVKTLIRLGNYKVRGIDWGIAHPTTCLWAAFDSSRALDPVSNPIYIYDEYGKTGQVISESASTIKAKTGDTPIEWTVIDPSTKKRNSQTVRTDADEFARYGVHCIPGDNRDRGVDVVKMFFKKDLVVVDPKCKGLIQELLNLQWGDKIGDDYTDPLRYLLLRVHDITFNGHLFDETVVYPNAKVSREINFNDPVLFPEDRKLDLNQWIIEEVS